MYAHSYLRRSDMPYTIYRIREAVPGLYLLSNAELSAYVAEIMEDFQRLGRDVSFDAVCAELAEGVAMRCRLLAVA